MGIPDQAGSGLNGQEQDKKKEGTGRGLLSLLETSSRSLRQLGLPTAFKNRVGLGNAGIHLKSVPSSREP